MLRSKVLACLVAGLVVTVAVAAAPSMGAVGNYDRFPLAQTPLGKFISGQIGRLMVLRSELNVTEEQRTKLREIVLGHKTDIAKAAEGVWEKRVALRDAVLAEKPNEKAIRKAADELGKAVGDAAVLASKVAGEARPVLTDQQRDTIKECRKECQAATEKFFQKATQTP
jgi:Spy/CpxP family protein refolding chaperone